MSDVPTLYHRYKGRVYRIKLMPHGIDVERQKSGTAPVAKNISFESMTGLRNGKSWNQSAAEKLIDRYELQLAAEQDSAN